MTYASSLSIEIAMKSFCEEETWGQMAVDPSLKVSVLRFKAFPAEDNPKPQPAHDNATDKHDCVSREVLFARLCVYFTLLYYTGISSWTFWLHNSRNNTWFLALRQISRYKSGQFPPKLIFLNI